MGEVGSGSGEVRQGEARCGLVRFGGVLCSTASVRLGTVWYGVVYLFSRRTERWARTKQSVSAK